MTDYDKHYKEMKNISQVIIYAIWAIADIIKIKINKSKNKKHVSKSKTTKAASDFYQGKRRVSGRDDREKNHEDNK